MLMHNGGIEVTVRVGMKYSSTNSSVDKVKLQLPLSGINCIDDCVGSRNILLLVVVVALAAVVVVIRKLDGNVNGRDLTVDGRIILKQILGNTV